MIPLRDTIQTRSYPVVNSLLIGANVFMYLVQISQGTQMNRLVLFYGLLPVRYSVPEIAAQFSLTQQALPFFSYMFLHGGFWHILGNMWSLYIFGDNVEDRLGPFRYLLFYLLCGLGSGLSHLAINWHSDIPTIGASGAIAGVMGAYFLLYPKSRILTLIPIFFIPYFLELPAYFFLGIWFLLQFISAAGSQADVGGVAWWAHIGGFIFGVIFLKALLMIPELGLTRRLRPRTAKKKTHRLQVIRTLGSAEDPNLYGTIIVTPREALLGTRKMVNIPWGFQKRLIRITIPPGIRDGTTLRLTGMGRAINGRRRGDLHLKTLIQKEEGA